MVDLFLFKVHDDYSTLDSVVHFDLWQSYLQLAGLMVDISILNHVGLWCLELWLVSRLYNKADKN